MTQQQLTVDQFQIKQYFKSNNRASIIAAWYSEKPANYCMINLGMNIPIDEAETVLNNAKALILGEIPKWVKSKRIKSNFGTYNTTNEFIDKVEDWYQANA